MKKLFGIILATTMLASVPAFAKLDFKVENLSPDRTSMEYGAQIKEVAKVVSGFKWVASNGNGTGFTLSTLDNKMKHNENRFLADAMLYSLDMYAFDYKRKTVEMYARRSERVGYVEFFSQEDRGFQMHIKVIDNDTIEVFGDANEARESERIVFKKVSEFPKNTKVPDRLKSAKDSGLVF